ncbi:MAG: hypothetical protein NC400_09295 [Clostridium sp.]|nr:hypothetical protein [Clostridium sp.]
MTKREMLSMGRKAESIYTAMKKNRANCEKKEAIAAARHSISSFEEHIRKNGDTKACYMYINGISMPVLSA